VLNYTVTNGVLPDCQFGLTNKISRGFQERLSTEMLVFDIEKALYDGFICKMPIKNHPVYLLKLTMSFLTGRDFHCTIMAWFPGPIKFPRVCGFTSDPPKLNGCEMAVFADDKAIYCTNSSVAVIVQSLQDGIDTLQNYYISWKIKINPAKSQCILSFVIFLRLTLESVVLKYLGPPI
jgi:hypothetical protein